MTPSSNHPQRRDIAAQHPTPLFMSAPTEEASSSTTKSIDDVSQELVQVEETFNKLLRECKTAQDAEALRRDYLGKKGPINGAMRYMKELSPEDKPKLGAIVNKIKASLETKMSEAKEQLEQQEMSALLEQDRIDVTMPGLHRTQDIGRRHPLSMTMEKAVDIFVKLGYDTITDVEDSPEVETDYNCFEALNCPKDHPARDMQDTFYLTEDRELMLRTHTSAVQIRALGKRDPPLRIVAPGRVYRRDDIDATHSLMFHQIEILALEPAGELNIGHLKGTVDHFLKNMLGPDIQTRYRGSYFPFTEPSMEVDVLFRGKWMEVLGCGMVDPRVLEKAGIDPNEYSGFAAGFGVERFAMIIHGVKDLREFVKSDKRFLQQFPHFYDDGEYSSSRRVGEMILVLIVAMAPGLVEEECGWLQEQFDSSSCCRSISFSNSVYLPIVFRYHFLFFNYHFWQDFQVSWLEKPLKSPEKNFELNKFHRHLSSLGKSSRLPNTMLPRSLWTKQLLPKHPRRKRKPKRKRHRLLRQTIPLTFPNLIFVSVSFKRHGNIPKLTNSFAKRLTLAKKVDHDKLPRV